MDENAVDADDVHISLALGVAIGVAVERVESVLEPHHGAETVVDVEVHLVILGQGLCGS